MKQNPNEIGVGGRRRRVAGSIEAPPKGKSTLAAVLAASLDAPQAAGRESEAGRAWPGPTEQGCWGFILRHSFCGVTLLPRSVAWDAPIDQEHTKSDQVRGGGPGRQGPLSRAGRPPSPPTSTGQAAGRAAGGAAGRRVMGALVAHQLTAPPTPLPQEGGQAARPWRVASDGLIGACRGAALGF